MLGYSKSTRSMTSEEGNFLMGCAHYAKVPAGMVAKLLEVENRGKKLDYQSDRDELILGTLGGER